MMFAYKNLKANIIVIRILKLGMFLNIVTPFSINSTYTIYTILYPLSTVLIGDKEATYFSSHFGA